MDGLEEGLGREEVIVSGCELVTGGRIGSVIELGSHLRNDLGKVFVEKRRYAADAHRTSLSASRVSSSFFSNRLMCFEISCRITSLSPIEG
jgi:hypothetical protein